MDRYDPIRIIGEGSFGKVYLMRDKVKRSFACVKIIKIKNIPKKEREATKVEVDLLRRLNHPNIVRYLDSFLSKSKDSLCICMEYCDGGDLASQIKAARRNLFSESKILHWFVQLALGLHYMHTTKVLHRDLKTQNVFMLGNGRLVLGDLGISKVLDGTMDFAQTCIGTPYYMSPEIFKNKPYSFKSDVWALGCVLYELTTLNHAFDANSLNGLATKIVKGKYPPINAKYSRYLRELIGQMLLIEPKQRPDLEQILKKPFIKKHIINFFTDISSRPSNSIGEGTMIMKAAAGGGIASAIANDTNMISLKAQLSKLDMAKDLEQALQPKSNDIPSDDGAAIKLAKEQHDALKREQEHKKMVEAALEKLRKERETRANEVRQKAENPGMRRGVGIGIGGMPGVGMPGYAQPVHQSRVRRGYQQGRESKEEAPEPQPSSRVPMGRRRTYDDERAAAERAKKLSDDRKRELVKQQQEVEATRLRQEEKRREEHRKEQEVRRAREEAKAREQASRMREKRDEAKKLEDEQRERQARQADAVAKRESQREKERARQREEIDQLRRDKLELDRRTTERDKMREERRAQERQRMEGPPVPTPSYKEAAGDKGGLGGGVYDGIPRGGARAEAKDAHRGEKLVAINRRHAEKQAKEEQERIETVREAERMEEASRKAARDRAGLMNGQGRMRDSGDSAEAANPSQARHQRRVTSDNVPNGQKNREEKYEFDPTKPKQREAMDMDEMSNRLEELNRGKSRYESPVVAHAAPIEGGASDDDDDSQGSGLDGDSIMLNDGDDENNLEEQEDLEKKEEELKAELDYATMRVTELRQNLQATKSFLGPRLPTRQNTRGQPAGGGMGPLEDKPHVKVEGGDSDSDDSFLSDEEVEQVDDGKWDGNGNSKPPLHAEDKADQTIKRLKSPPTQGDRNPRNQYMPLQDAPSPSGRLADRIERLRQRCTEALGVGAFDDAYSFLKQHEEESQGYDNGRDMNDDDYERRKILKLRAILGEQKAHYGSLIEQLIFMEETHGM